MILKRAEAGAAQAFSMACRLSADDQRLFADQFFTRFTDRPADRFIDKLVDQFIDQFVEQYADKLVNQRHLVNAQAMAFSNRESRRPPRLTPLLREILRLFKGASVH